MKIKKIIIENFKFHHHLEFEISNNNNCLIYGENGSGKSSIYEALYSNFYYYKNKRIANGIIKIRDTFLHRNFPSGDFKVNILFDNSIYLNRTDENLTNDHILLAPEGNSEIGESNIYFANEKVLRHITDDNFFNIIENELIIHFPDLSKIISCYEDVNKSLKLLKTDDQINEDIIKQRKEADNLCETKLNELIPFPLINDILQNNLLSDFKIEYSFKESIIDINKKFHSPLINFKIVDVDDRDDFKNHFNEAKLKLISIAVYFALVKKYQTQNELKLLVLDDFLTSLDMANRKKIARFIIDYFEEYQIIILTHNIQFNNLLKKMINPTLWDTKILFTMKEDDLIVSKVKDKNDNYIEEAKNFINTSNYNLAIAGNLLRKAFEGIINEFEQLLELGKVEALKIMINCLRNDNKIFYKEPNDALSNLHKQFNKMIIERNNGRPDNTIIDSLKEIFENLESHKITFKKESSPNIEYNIIQKTEFFKNILLNPSSHNNIDSEIYKQECENTIILLEELNKIIATLKKD